MDQKKVFIAILGMTAVTYLPRLLPSWFLASRQIPPTLVTWLRFVPTAVMAAMLLPCLVLRQGSVAFNAGNVHLWAALPTLAFAIATRHFLGTIVTGCVLVAAGRLVSGS